MEEGSYPKQMSHQAQYFVPARLIYVLNRLKLVVKLSWLIFFP